MTVIDMTTGRPRAPQGWPSCRVCGCWHMDACWDDDAGPCWWVEEDLCSHCAAKREGLRPSFVPSAERPGVSSSVGSLCFGVLYGFVVGLVVGLVL